MLVDRLEEASQPSLLDRERARADSFKGVLVHPTVSSSIARVAPAI